MGEPDEFSNLLKSRLLQGNSIRVYHVSTLPSTCPPLFAPASRRSEEATTLESHFLAISQTHPTPSDLSRDEADVLVLGIEVLIFTTSNLTTVFVSKADSTGLLTRPSTASSRTSLAQTTITAFLDFLLTPRLNRGRLVLSLFARSQNQYLFPGSIENVTKHVLDDRQLIKWWCKILDPVARQARNRGPQDVTAHVVVPGCDSSETKSFFPPSTLADSTSSIKWSNTFPVDLLVQDTSLPPRCLVPRLPDDPKSRFLNDLDAHVDENGIWRGIKTLDQFWEMMSYRQECSAGRLVGFVWVVFTSLEAVGQTAQAGRDGIVVQQSRELEHHLDQQPTSLPEAAAEHCLTDVPRHSAPATAHSVSSLDVTTSATSPITPLRTTVITTTPPSTNQMDKDAVTTNGHLSSNIHGPHTASGYLADKPLTSDGLIAHGRAVLSAEHYQDLVDELLLLDFAGQQTAVESTQKWRDMAMKLAGTAHFGVFIEGTAIPEEALASIDAKAKPTINVLTGLRKKRKVESVEPANEGRQNIDTSVKTLDSSFLHKKPKSSVSDGDLDTSHF